MSLENDSPTGNQTMTRFICQELLYEFATGNLDLERQKAIDAHLTECRESQRELEKLKAGFQFTTRMSRVQVSEPLLAALLGFEPVWKKSLRRWTLWWSDRGWKALPYAIFAAVLVLTALVIKPWTNVNHREVVLAENLKPETALASSPAGALVPGPVETKSEPAAPAVTPPPTTVTEEAPPAPEYKPILFTGRLTVKEFAEAWPQIRDKIVELGGKQAGEDALGIERESGISYFDVSLPESKQKELEAYLKTFGRVRFKQVAESRVMPDGEIHIILTVKDGSSHEQPPPPSEETQAP